MTKATFKTAYPYKDDALNLPVADVEAAIPYYENHFGFKVISRENLPHKRVVLARDNIRIGLAQNGGDSSQEGCFFEVDDIEAAHDELGEVNKSPIKQEEREGKSRRVFFVIAPDGLCYMFAQPT